MEQRNWVIAKPPRYKTNQVTTNLRMIIWFPPFAHGWIESANATPKRRVTKQLSVLARNWSENKDKRFLPTFAEYVSAFRFLKRRNMTEAVRALMTRATKYYGLRASVLLLALAVLAAGWIAIIGRQNNAPRAKLRPVLFNPRSRSIALQCNSDESAQNPCCHEFWKRSEKHTLNWINQTSYCVPIWGLALLGSQEGRRM